MYLFQIKFIQNIQIAMLMLRFGFLLFVFCFVANARAQKIDSDFFLGDEWAIRNGDSLFFKSDTLRMIKLAKRQSKQSRNIAVNLADYYKTDFVLINFVSKKKAHISYVSINSWLMSRRKGSYTWKFNDGDQVLGLYYNRQPVLVAKIAGVESIVVPSNIAGDVPFAVEELILIRTL